MAERGVVGAALEADVRMGSVGEQTLDPNNFPTGAFEFDDPGSPNPEIRVVPPWTLDTGVPSFTMPPGIILPFAGATPPSASYLLCDGAAISRSTYAALFAVIGTRWGRGDGSTTFNVPDARGRFLRGLDSTSSRDPDRLARVISGSGTTWTMSCTTTNLSPNVTCASTENLCPGMSITGTGIPASTVVRSITNGTTFVLGNQDDSANVNATTSATNTMTFSAGATADYVGSAQTTATKLPTTAFTFTTGTESADHTHTVPGGNTAGGTTGFSAPSSVTVAGSVTSSGKSATHTHSASSWGGGDNESRPPNVDVNYIITV